MLAFFLQGAVLGFSAAVSPGPFQAYLLAQTVQHGLRRTLPSALAPLLSDGPIIALVLLALTQAPGWLLRGLQIAGGLFVLYLAWGAYRAFRQPPTLAATPADTAGRSLLKAVVTNALSPGPWLFWTVLAGPILARAWGQAPGWAVGFVGGFYGAMIGSLAGLIVLFATARRLGPSVAHALNGVSALALLGFGLYQLWGGLVGAS